MTTRTRLALFHLLKLENALLALASLIQQGNLLYSKKEAISAEKYKRRVRDRQTEKQRESEAG